MTTIQVNGDDIMMAIHVVRIVGTIVTIIVVAALFAWAIRPSRRARDRRALQDEQAADNEELWRVVDRMEARLDVLERAMADQVEPRLPRAKRRDGILASAEEGRDSGRTE